jgi:hypothetical protein
MREKRARDDRMHYLVKRCGGVSKTRPSIPLIRHFIARAWRTRPKCSESVKKSPGINRGLAGCIYQEE